MSATNRGATRKEHDFYPTPVHSFAPMFDEFKPFAFESEFIWLEPCRGDGRIYKAMPEPKVWAEIQEGRDYLAIPLPADICMTNPPFGLALKFAQKALAECRTVVFLQRLNWLGSEERRAFWQANPPTHLFPLSKRPAFSAERITAKVIDLFETEIEIGGEKGTDSIEYGWFVWDRLGVMRRPPGVYVL